MSNVTYKRGQVEWGLWRAVPFNRGTRDAPPPIFRTRIKRLLDLDRDLDVASFGAAPESDFAFVALADGGSGIEMQYAPFDVFCLAIALDLLDVGFKQGEIVYLMRHLRDTLEGWFSKLLDRPSLNDRQPHLASKFPKLPVLQRSGGKAPLADARVFLVLNRIEMTEVLPVAKVRGKAKPAVFLAPIVCEGITGLAEQLNALMPLHRRTVVTLEIAAVAQAIVEFLAVAPLVPRGRPRLDP